jgi:hypothetical protein
MAVSQTSHGTMRASAAKRKRLKKLHVSKTDNGGYIVSHHHQPEHGGTPAAEKHAFTSYDDMHAHVEKTMRGHRG